MEWSLFWTAFGAIGGTLGAFATFAAVIVALWQTKYAYKKKLKLHFDDNTRIVDNRGEVIINCVSLTATNIGNREIIIKRWGFDLKNKHSVLIFSDIPSESTSILFKEPFVTKFPYTLQIEQQVTLYYERELFQEILPNYISNKELDANKPIKFFVIDSTGHKYFIKTRKVANDLCK